MLTEKTLEQLLKEKLISQRTYDKVVLSKQYIERKYNFKNHVNNEMKNFIDNLYLQNVNKEKINQIQKEIYEKEMINFRKAREKQSIRDYESLSIIGRGAFGEVHVCREKKTGTIVAIKKIKKDVLILKNQIIHIRNEQLFMSNVKSPWIVDLKASFQEDDYLYLIMEFCPGGDLMNLLIEKDILTEDEARFYLAELILAIESIHKLDCIHRDIKPDNILIDETGHIKLSDFGLAKISEKIFENRLDINSNTLYHHNKNYSCVGTAYYVAPEVLKKKGYGPEIDWWSAGIIFYEMLIGYAPFCSKDTSEVCYKVLNWKKYFKFPSKIKISSEAQDLIIKLINNPSKRLGKNGASEIKKHPFFDGLDWDNIRNLKPPFIPKIKNEYDIKYFEIFEEDEPFYPTPKRFPKRKDIEYLGYTYKEDNDLYDMHKKFEKSILDNIKKIITVEDNNNKTTKTNCTSSGSGRIPSTINYPFTKVDSNCIANKQLTFNNEIFKTEINPKNNKLNIIQLPKRKSKMNKNINKKGTIDVNYKSINNKRKINIGQIIKNKSKPKRLSPEPKPEVLLKILNLNNIKIKKNSKSKNANNRSKSKKSYSTNRSCSNTNKEKDSSFNYNSSLLKQLVRRSIGNKSFKKKIINEKRKNNLKIFNNIHNKSYQNNVINAANDIIHNRVNFKKQNCSTKSIKNINNLS